MAQTVTELASPSSGAADSIGSGDVTPTGSALVKAFVTLRDTDNAVPDPGVGNISGTGWASGLTWTERENLTLNLGGTQWRMKLFEAYAPSSPSAGAVTVTAPGAAGQVDGWAMHLIETAGDTNTPTYQQSATNTSTASTTFSVTLDSAPDAAAAQIAVMYQTAGGAAVHTAGTGYTALSTEDEGALGALFQTAEYDLTAPADGIADISSDVSASWFGITVEVEEVAAVSGHTMGALAGRGGLAGSGGLAGRGGGLAG